MLERQLARPRAVLRRQGALVGAVFADTVHAPRVVDGNRHPDSDLGGSDVLQHFAHRLTRPDAITAYRRRCEDLAYLLVADRGSPVRRAQRTCLGDPSLELSSADRAA